MTPEAALTSQPPKPPRNKGGRPVGYRPGQLDKSQLERLLSVLVKSKDTPIQYKSALATNIAMLKGWRSTSEDSDSRVDMGAFLRSWARENVLGAAINRRVSPVQLAQQAAANTPTEAAGDPPVETQTEAVDPLTKSTTPENSAVSVGGVGIAADVKSDIPSEGVK